MFFSLAAQVEQLASRSLQDQLRRHGPVCDLRRRRRYATPPHLLAGQVPGVALRQTLPILHNLYVLNVSAELCMCFMV